MSRFAFHLSIITRLPEPGASKTRLIPVLGEQGAADLQRQMTEHVARQARICAAVGRGGVEVRVTGGTAAEAERWRRAIVLVPAAFCRQHRSSADTAAPVRVMWAQTSIA